MDEISRVVSFMDKYGIASGSLLNLHDETTLESKLFTMLQDGKVKTDEEAALLLYGTNELTANYRMLKSRFRKKLYNHLFFLKPSASRAKNIQDATYECYGLLTQALGLRLMNEKKAALKVLDQVLQIASDFDLNELKVQVLEEKMLLYMSLDQDKQYTEAEKLLNHCYFVQAHEREAVALFDHTMMEMKSTTSMRQKLFQKLPATIAKLKNLFLLTDSAKIYHQTYLLQIFYLEQIGNYAEVIKTVEDTEELIDNNSLSEGWFTLSFNSFAKLYALLQCRRYEQGVRFAAENVVHFTRYSFNWFGFMENYVVLALHSKNYKLAETLLIDATAKGHLDKMHPTSKERWELYRRYFILVRNTIINNTFPSEPPLVIEQLSVLPKDKAGFNLALLVLDVFEGLKKYGSELQELQAERVRKYSSKYLKGEKAERPRLFMRLLQTALQEQDVALARKRGEPIVKKLEKTPLPGDAFTEIEIVPYEHLWELALQLLRQRVAN